MSLLGDVAELAILIKLRDEVTGPLGRIDKGLAGLNTRSNTVGGGFQKMGAGLAMGAERAVAATAVAGAAVGSLIVDATKSAMSYQSAMELLRTQAGATQQEVNDMAAAVLRLAPQVGTGPDELAAGLYHIESAGMRGAKALDILRVSAEGAKVGHADLESVTNALIAATYSEIKGTSSMSESMGVLNAIVGVGNMRMADLAGAMSTGVLSAAKTFGLSIQDVGAALATMTDQGVPAEEAATRLRMTFSLLAAPSSKAGKLFHEIGLSALQLGDDMRKPNGLITAISDLRNHMVKAGMIGPDGGPNTKGADFLSQAFGGGRSSSAIMLLIGSLDKMGGKLGDIQKGASSFGDAWGAASADADVKAAKFGAAVDALKIKLGQELLPVASELFDKLTEVVSSPEVAAAMEDFGKTLAGMFSPQNVDGAIKFGRDILPPLESGLSVLGGLAKEAFDLFNKLPPELKTVAIAALIGNKLTGGLVTSGIGTVAGALLRRGAGASGGGALGGLLGVQRVFVVNMPPGGLGGGLPAAAGEGAAGEAAAAAGGLLAPGAMAAAVAVAVPLAMMYLPVALSGGNTPAQPLATRAGILPATGTTSADFFSGLMPGFRAAAGRATPTSGESRSMRDDVTDPLLVEMHAARDDAALNRMAVVAELRQSDNTINRAANRARDDAQAQLRGTADAKRAVADGLALVRVYTAGTAKNTTNLGSNIEILRGLQARFLATGDTVTAGKLGADIARLQAVLHGDLSSQQTALERIAGRDDNPPVVNVSVTTNVSPRNVAYQTVTYARYGNIVTAQ